MVLWIIVPNFGFMDKTLKRTILFKRGMVVNKAEKPKESVVENAEAVKLKTKGEIKTGNSSEIKAWFLSHPLLSINGICKEAGLDTSNFNKLLNSDKEMPKDKIDLLLPIIKQYGF